jgi:DNA-3-methyladenine glycosylase
MTKLPRAFYLRSTLQVAKALLGKYLVRNLDGQTLIGKVVEVEGYMRSDPASHAFRGRTARNDVMFGQGGHGYVYFTYGMYHCFNVVTRAERVGEAVLIRAVEPLQGIEVMKRFRGNVKSNFELTNGPGKLCIAFGIDKRLNGVDLLGDELFITNGERVKTSQIQTTTRIGIQVGVEKKWRFFIKGNSFVSRGKPV